MCCVYVYVYVYITRVKKIGNGVSTLSSYRGIVDSLEKFKTGGSAILC